MTKKKASLKDRHEGMRKMHKKNYDNICEGVTATFNSWACDACGAYAPTPEEVEHFIHCPLKEEE